MVIKEWYEKKNVCKIVEGAAVSNRKEIRKLTSEHIELFIFFFLFLHIFLCWKYLFKNQLRAVFLLKLLIHISFQAVFDMMRTFKKKCCTPLSNKRLFCWREFLGRSDVSYVNPVVVTHSNLSSRHNLKWENLFVKLTHALV